MTVTFDLWSIKIGINSFEINALLQNFGLNYLILINFLMNVLSSNKFQGTPQ